MDTPNSSPGAGPLAPAVAPTLTVSSPPSGIAGTTVTLTGTGFTGVTSVTFGGVPSGAFTVVSATRITATAPAGSGTVQIVVNTTGGSSNGIDFTYTTPTPVLTGLVPVAGPVAGGTTVTLTGTNLSGVTAVRFGLFTASFTAVSATQITAVAPASAAPTTVNVTVTTAGGTSNGLPYAYVAAPALTSVTPTQGPSSGGTTVTLTGTNLTGATSVAFGTAQALAFTVVSATQISAVAPAGAAGAVPVTVTTPGGVSTGSVFFYYLPAPLLTSVSPTAGPTAGGTAVTLTGSGLLTANSVSFGGTPAASFAVVSDVQVTAVSPPGAAGSVAVTVGTPAGTSNGVAYTYAPVPVLTALAPSVGPLSGGAIVTLTGSGLSAATAVLFGAVPASFAAVSDGQITAQAPAGGAGAVSVTVVTPGGTSAGLPYTRVPPPAI